MRKKIILDGKNSDWYKRATFILKDQEQPYTYPKSLEMYAEELIENYLKRGGKSNPPHKHYKWIDRFFFISIGLLIFVSGLLVLMNF